MVTTLTTTTITTLVAVTMSSLSYSLFETPPELTRITVNKISGNRLGLIKGFVDEFQLLIHLAETVFAY